MPRNGSGSYSRVAGTPYVYNTAIDQIIVNNEMDDIATALTNSVAKNGETTMTANLPMGGYKLTGLAAGTGNGDSIRHEQVATSAALRALVFDETGGGALVFAESPTLVTPILGTPTSGDISNCTGSPALAGTNFTGTAAALNIGGNSASATSATNATNATGSAAVTGAVSSSSATAGVGYASGAGGSVTQITSVTTAVTLNKVSGLITTVSFNATAGTDYQFILNNSVLSSGDIVVVNNNYGSYFTCTAARLGYAAAIINLHCISSVNVTPGGVDISFAIIKAVSS